VRLCKEIFGAHLSVTYRPSAEHDYLVDNPNRRCPDISKAREHLGFAPKMTLEAGLRRALLWYSGNLGGTEQ
jgi:nucleoside-diphosphate-sugar epimerase